MAAIGDHSSLQKLCSTPIISKGTTYFVKPLELIEVSSLKAFLAEERSFDPETVSRVVDKLAKRIFSHNPLNCFLIWDPQKKLAGYLTFELAHRGPFIFFYSDLKKSDHFLYMICDLWNWTKQLLDQMNQRKLQIRNRPIRQMKICTRVSAEDLSRIALLEQQGFELRKKTPSEPPRNTVYRELCPVPKNSRFYQISVAKAISLKSPVEKTFGAWMDILQELSSPPAPCDSNTPSEAKRQRRDMNLSQ